MDMNVIQPSAFAGKKGSPATRAEAQARLAEIDDAIAAIKTQIAAADLARQARRQKIDPSWFHRAKTALRHMQRERSERLAQLGCLPRPKEGMKDSLIAVLREQHDEACWSRFLDEAHRRLATEDAR